MLPVVARHTADAAADALSQPIILARTQQMAVARQHILADRRHLAGRQAWVDVEISERAVEAGDMLLQAEGLAVKAPGHVEDRIAAQKPLVAERDQDFALPDDPAVEPGDAFVCQSHPRTSRI